MVDVEVPDVEYEPYSNRQLALIPLAVLGVALLVIVGWYLVTGVPVNPGIDFTGGTEIRLEAGDSAAEVRETFAGLNLERIQPVRGGNEYVLVTQAEDTTPIQEAAAAAEYSVITRNTVSAALGASAQQLALLGLAVAFVLMGLLVFALFRTFVPSVAIIVSALSDIVIPIAAMNLLGIELSLGTVAALLMLIGYSVDSDLLLNNHILRRRGDFYESAYRARRTGVTMTLTSICAMIVMWFVGSLFAIDLLPEVGLILAVGLTADLMNTYLLNMSLLRYYKYEGVTG